jgi:hypothetical protein
MAKKEKRRSKPSFFGRFKGIGKMGPGDELN